MRGGDQAEEQTYLPENSVSRVCIVAASGWPRGVQLYDHVLEAWGLSYVYATVANTCQPLTTCSVLLLCVLNLFELIEFSQHSCKTGTVIIPTFQLKKLKGRGRI